MQNNVSDWVEPNPYLGQLPRPISTKIKDSPFTQEDLRLGLICTSSNDQESSMACASTEYLATSLSTFPYRYALQSMHQDTFISVYYTFS